MMDPILEFWGIFMKVFRTQNLRRTLHTQSLKSIFFLNLEMENVERDGTGRDSACEVSDEGKTLLRLLVRYRTKNPWFLVS